MSDQVIEITEANFQEHAVAGGKPLVVDFWAEWCGPCRAIVPLLEKLAGENTGVTFGKLNIDEHPNIASKYSVQAIPTLILFKEGEESGRVVGGNVPAITELIAKI